jgi:hypothetical protein
MEGVLGQNGPKKGRAEGVAEGVALPRNVIFPLMGGVKPLTPPPWLRPCVDGIPSIGFRTFHIHCHECHCQCCLLSCARIPIEQITYTYFPTDCFQLVIFSNNACSGGQTHTN